jgi:hypothetical protein
VGCQQMRVSLCLTGEKKRSQRDQTAIQLSKVLENDREYVREPSPRYKISGAMKNLVSNERSDSQEKIVIDGQTMGLLFLPYLG